MQNRLKGLQLVKSPRQWPHSSIHRFIKNGLCEPGWGSQREMQFDAAVGSEWWKLCRISLSLYPTYNIEKMGTRRSDWMQWNPTTM